MTSNVLDAKPKPPKPLDKGLAIGETDANVFNCPSCARALAEGTSVCPGCGSRLIMGVLLRRAGLILALGMVVGMLVGGALMASVITLSLRDSAARAAAAAAAAAASPSPSPSASVAPSPTGMAYSDAGVPGAPAGALTALRGTAVLNSRIAVDRDSLAATLARQDAATIEVARALRSLARDAALGRDLSARMAAWGAAGSVVGGLDEFYLAIEDTARTGLRASLSDGGSYRATGTTMLGVLDGLAAVEDAARVFAATIGIELAPSPAATPSAPTPSAGVSAPPAGFAPPAGSASPTRSMAPTTSP